MTESPDQTPEASPTRLSAEAQARIDQLRRGRTDRTAPATRQKRRHPAQGARIAAGGLGLAAMLGLVGAMGYANRSTGPAQPAVAPAPAPAGPAPQIVIVIHRGAETTTSTATALANGAPSSAAPAGSTPTVSPVAIPVVKAAAPAAPTALTAKPVVRKAPVAQVPIAKTNGSK